ncbi:O-methyltransferase [Colwellia sp. TT2012]|uniref:O-methyltransferase n=1 Tax=Colwellia sp. TT2012 TaxID=1720342 RepID=UPI00070A5B6C|nr:O-methyltransferase [Colwellia sp. TT2012]
MASGDVINYSIRPAKTVERKIIRDLFSKLTAFQPLSNYKYIGFGSKYFSDFKLFHKDLHINDMVSIEADKEYSEKYKFNKPFDCIDLRFGFSTDVLVELKYDKPYICWLDYDYAIKKSVIDDIDILLENLENNSGSIIAMSLNVRPYNHNTLKEELKNAEGTHQELLKQKLDKLVESHFVPILIPKQGLNKAATVSEIIRQILINKITNKLNLINSALEVQDKWQFKQIFNFLYSDGAPMATWGWVFYKQCEHSKYNLCDFDSSEFYSSNERVCEIKIPNFTIKEINNLLECMPLKKPIDRKRLPANIYVESDVEDFSKIYKYYPTFVNADFG